MFFLGGVILKHIFIFFMHVLFFCCCFTLSDVSCKYRCILSIFYDRNACKTFFLFFLYFLLIPNWFIQKIVLIFHWNRITSYGYALLLKTIHYWHTCMIVSKLLLLCTFLINYIYRTFSICMIFVKQIPRSKIPERKCIFICNF